MLALGGILAGLRASWCPPALAVGLLGAGVAARGRWGLAVGGLALGLVTAAVRGSGELPGLDPGRPVVAVGRVADHWRVDGRERTVRFRLARLRQGGGVERCAAVVWLVLPVEGEAAPPGTRLRVRGYLRRSPGFANGIAVPPGPWRLRVKSPRLVEVEAAPAWLPALAARLRAVVERSVAAAAAGRAGPPGGHGLALVKALVLADASEVPEPWRRGLRRSGLSHLLAVSGLHVGLVAGTVLLLAAPLPWRVRLLLGLTAVTGYLLLAGPRPALLRAALMGLLAGLALLGERAPSGPNALAVAVAALALDHPALVDDLGFRLTASATAGIVFVAPRLERAWRRDGDRRGGGRRGERQERGLPPILARSLAATVGAQLVSLPVAAPAFHLVSLTAPLTNLVAVPWTALTLAVGLAWTALATLSPSAAALGLPALDLLAAPFGWPAMGPPVAWGTVAAVAPVAFSAALAAALLAWAPRPLRRLPLLLAVAVMLPAWRWGGGGPRSHPGAELVVLDVGQGDAILLRDGPEAVLVDGGGWPAGDLGGRVLVPALVHEGVPGLRAAILTHADRDHCGGLVDLASYLPIGEVWLSAAEPAEGGCAAELLAAAVGQRAGVRRLRPGDRAAIGRWRLTVLHPAVGSAGGRDNDLSVVLLATALGRRVLLTGDLEAAGEARLVSRWGSAVRADVLKVGHHGSKGASGPSFLAAVRPRLALVSAGSGNPYGHPAPAVLDRFAARRVRVLRTDRDGLLHVALDPATGESRTLRIAVGGR
jgi:competence protein ComEC